MQVVRQPLTLVTCSYGVEGGPEHPCGSKKQNLKGEKCSKSTRKVQYVRQAATGSGNTEQKVFEVKGCATGRGILCNLVVLRKCSKMGTFFSSLDVSWSTLNHSPAEKCSKVPEKCSMCDKVETVKWR